MITVEHRQEAVLASVFNEFTLADYREFERGVEEALLQGGRVNALLDLSDMASFTLDTAWEDLRFARQHGHDFGRFAVVSDRRWTTWAAWVYRAFVDAEVEVFENYDLACDWLGVSGGSDS